MPNAKLSQLRAWSCHKIQRIPKMHHNLCLSSKSCLQFKFIGIIFKSLLMVVSKPWLTESGIPHTSESCECGNLLAMEKFKFQASHEILCNWLKKCNNLRIAKQKNLKMGWVLNAGIESIQFFDGIQMGCWSFEEDTLAKQLRRSQGNGMAELLQNMKIQPGLLWLFW